MFKQLCYKCGGKVKKSYKKGGQLPRYQQAGEFEEGLRQMEGEEDFSFLYDQMQPQPESQQSSQFYPQNPPLPQLDPNSAGIPIKQSSPDDLSFRDWYRAQIMTGQPGQVAEWRGKKYLLDPRDFQGQQRQQAAPRNQSVSTQQRNQAQARNITPVQQGPNFNWLQDRRQQGIDMISGNTTPSSRSNTPVRPQREATQAENTAKVNGDKSFWSHPATKIAESVPNVDFGNPVLNYLHSVSPFGTMQELGKGTFEAISRLGSGAGKGSAYENTPWYVNPVFDAAGVFGGAGAGAAARGAGNAGKIGEGIGNIIPKIANAANKMGYSKVPSLSKNLIKQGIDESKAGEQMFNKIRNSQGYLQRMNNIGKEDAFINLQREINSLPKTAQKKVNSILKKLNKAEANYKMGGGIPLFEDQNNYYDESMLPLEYMKYGGSKRMLY